MGSIIFLRHGQATNNTERVLAGRTPGVPLTERGMEQAADAAKLLGGMNVSAVYSSPIERAASTAKIVGRHMSLDVSLDDRLIELDMGKFTGMPYDEVFSSHGNVFMKFYSHELEVAHSGIETFSEVKKRVLSMVSDAAAEHPNGNVLLVTHMDPIKAMLSTVLALSPKNLYELIIANAALTVFRSANGGFALSGLNLMHPSRFDQQW